MKINYGDLGLGAGEPEEGGEGFARRVFEKIRDTPLVHYERRGEYWLKISTTVEVMPEGFTPPRAEVHNINEARGQRTR